MPPTLPYELIDLILRMALHIGEYDTWNAERMQKSEILRKERSYQLHGSCWLTFCRSSAFIVEACTTKSTRGAVQ